MVGKKTLKDYEIDHIYDYYDMVLESLVNGQRTQAKEQGLRLTKLQRYDCLCHIANITADNNNEIEFFQRLFIIGE